MNLTELQRDVLKELVNVGVGRAASSLNELTGSPILLHVPELEIMTLHEASRRIAAMGLGKQASVQLSFSGFLQGNIALVFPFSSAATLVALLTRDEGDYLDVDGLRAATLEETGNLILNGVVGSIANALDERIVFALPYYSEQEGLPDRVVGGSSGSPDLIFARARFTTSGQEIWGDIYLYFAAASLSGLTAALDRAILVAHPER
jgi:chemotaxis protein CheC